MMPGEAGIRLPGFSGDQQARLVRRHASRRPVLSAHLSSCRWLAWTSPVGRAVRACGDAVRAGWLVLQAIVSEGQEAGRA